MLVASTREKAVKMNRSRYEIMAWIMQSCLLPRSKTHIIHKGNLSFPQTNAYLSLLTSLDLLVRQDGKYETTDKGRQFLSAYNQLDQLIGMPESSLTEMRLASSSSSPTNY